VLDAPLETTAVAVSPEWSTDHTVFAGVNGGVLRSVDGGATWSASVFPPPAPLVTALAVSPGYARDGVVLCGTMEDGVFRSSDRGSTWSPWNFGLLDLGVLALTISPAFVDDETLFAGTESGLFRSRNGGRAWREVDLPGDGAAVLSVALSPNYAGDGIIFVGTESGTLFRSDDHGRTWMSVGESVMTDAVNAVVLAPRFPTTRDVLVLLSDALLVSRDQGLSWAEWQSGMDFGQGAAVITAPYGLDPDAPLLVGLVEGGIVRLDFNHRT